MTDRPTPSEQPGVDAPAPEGEPDTAASHGSSGQERSGSGGEAPAPRPAEEPSGPRPVDPDRVARAYAEHGAPPSGAADAAAAPEDADAGDPGEVAAEQPDWTGLAERDPRSPAELLAELTEAEARRDEYLEDVRRARAEFENYRKRVMKEGTAQRIAGVTEVVTRLLDVLDDFDRTVEAAQQSEDEGLRKGVELVYTKLVEVLRGFGLERIDAAGAHFDPNLHEAVQQVPADDEVDEPVVHQVLRPGYQVAGRVVRAAMVVVAQ